MSNFKIEVTHITGIQPIPGADRIVCAYVYGMVPCVVSSGKYNIGDLIAYIPIESCLPDSLVKEMELEGKLKGTQNRVKAVRLKKQYSEGLIYPARSHWKEGDNVMEELGITKYEEPEDFHRARGAGKCIYDGTFTYWDFESIHKLTQKQFEYLKNNDYSFEVSEKIHGQSVRFAMDKDNNCYVSTKNIGNVNCYIDLNDQKMPHTKVFHELNIKEKLLDFKQSTQCDSVCIIGEIYGKGLQDLDYGTDKVKLVAFSFLAGNYNETSNRVEYREINLNDNIVRMLQLPAPYLFSIGDLDKFQTNRDFVDYVKQYVDGYELQSGERKHIREGVVIRFDPPISEYSNLDYQTYRTKFVSEAYKLRNNGTEKT